MPEVPPIATFDIHCPTCDTDLCQRNVAVDVPTGRPAGTADPDGARAFIQEMRQGTNYYPTVVCPGCNTTVSLAGNPETAALAAE